MKFFNSIAPLYDSFMGLFNQNRFLKRLMAGLSFEKGERLLDIGGGTGRLLEHLPSFLDVVLLDSSPRMLERAKWRVDDFSSYELLHGRAEHLPFENHSFDYVICADALHHFEGIRESLGEMVRVLKSTGIIKILEFHPKSTMTRIISFMEKKVGEPGHFYRPEELVMMLEEEGCQVQSVILSSSQYMLEARRREE